MTVERGSVPVSWDAEWRLDLPDGDPPAGGWPVLVALHGFGDDGPGLAERLGGLSDAPYARLWPDGPFPVEMREDDIRRIGRAWYQYDGDQERFRAALDRCAAFVLEVVDRVAAGHPIDAARAAVLGYSMGGYVAGWTGFHDRERWRGVVSLASRIKAEAIDLTGAAGQRVLVFHGAQDRFISAARAEESADLLRSGGAEVTFETWDGGHGLRPEVAPRVDAFVRDVFGIG